VNVESEEYAPGLPLGAQVNRALLARLIETADDLQALARELRPSRRRGSAQLRELLRPRIQDLARVALHLERLTDTDKLLTQLEHILPDADRQPSYDRAVSAGSTSMSAVARAASVPGAPTAHWLD
jgi:hypothetical protein